MAGKKRPVNLALSKESRAQLDRVRDLGHRRTITSAVEWSLEVTERVVQCLRGGGQLLDAEGKAVSLV